MRSPGNCRGYDFRGMNGCARDDRRYAGGDQAGGCDDAECHSERTVDHLGGEADRDQDQVLEIHRWEIHSLGPAWSRHRRVGRPPTNTVALDPEAGQKARLLVNVETTARCVSVNGTRPFFIWGRPISTALAAFRIAGSRRANSFASGRPRTADGCP